MSNPYPEFITDESTGQEVPNVLYKAWQEGVKEVVEYIDTLPLTPVRPLDEVMYWDIRFPRNVWQAKLKEWGIK